MQPALCVYGVILQSATFNDGIVSHRTALGHQVCPEPGSRDIGTREVLLMLLNQALSCAEHDRWRTPAPRTSRAQRQAQRGPQDIHRMNP